MHKAGAYLVGLLGPATKNRRIVTARAMSAAESNALQAALKQDARDYFYSSCLTYCSSLFGLTESQYTWSTVKLYYSVFYALRCELALNGICIFYVKASPFTLRAIPGAFPKIERESTHKTVLATFEREFGAGALLSQNIGLDSPLRWLMERREEANYKVACFPDPTAPRHFEEVEKNGLRSVLSTYIEDKSHVYTFDPDHAMLAYPTKVLLSVGQSIASASLSLSPIERSYLKKVARDSSGPFTNFLS